ncbi:hypothetical protein NDU88_001527 [Pleurodeles waltl]|uniref:Uncharacterized protein n=1 Tax=Pleurodeles waltl TaxID=8319 RepID=A0AAV7THY1_PLEWA|nr:hypothetical protein NDU88_001527 [Pleurodeles waltl]
MTGGPVMAALAGFLTLPFRTPFPATLMSLDVYVSFQEEISNGVGQQENVSRGDPISAGELRAFMGLLCDLICWIRGPLPSRPEGPVYPFLPLVTVHQTSTSLEAITQPGSGSLLCCQQGHRYRRPSVTTIRCSTRPECRITPRRAAGGPSSSRSLHPPCAASSIEAPGIGVG